MNEYLKLKRQHQKEVNEFPMFFAFNNKQLEEGLKKFNVTKDEICSIGAGGFMKKTDSILFKNMYEKHRAEMDEAILGDKTGEGFIRDMIQYEMDNHEYSYTGDIEDTLDALGLTIYEIINNPALKNGFKLAGGYLP
jgi:hypothetical protein